MSASKRKPISIEEKSRIISKIESGVPNKDLVKEYGVRHSTISSIWKARDKIKTLYDKNCLKMKRSRTTKHAKIEDAVLKWYRHQRTNNVPINGPMLQQKANELAQRFDEDFVFTPSWVQRFRARHGIVGRITSVEVASVDKGTVDNWMTQKWPTIWEGYRPEDIFNADETGLFYNMKPDRISKFKGENCSGGKMAETRLTIMVAANMTGSCKRKLLVIGNYKTPECFKTGSLPVIYENNVKSWMTLEIFERWLRNWDDELKANNKKVLLLVNTCAAHMAVTNLKFIKLVFLPSNVLQPMDQGVIRCIKSNYRKLQVLQLLQNLETNNEKSLTVLDAILMVAEAWENVSRKTIADCFIQAGFTSMHDDDEEDNISLCQLAQNLRPALSTTEANEFIDVDKSVAICEATTEDHVRVQIVKEEYDKQEYSEEQLTVPELDRTLNDAPVTVDNIVRKVQVVKEEYDDEEYFEELFTESTLDDAPATEDPLNDGLNAYAQTDDIVQVREVQEFQEEYDNHENSEKQFTMPTLNDCLNAVSVLRKIFLFNDNFHMQGNYDDTLIRIQRELQNVYARQKCSKQAKMHIEK
ncbi:tigger transposable element-derived protein 4-like [Bicyclus anynana]|uniref:Tigger transposable element-derived protein 4-like n=1 Tax=Bicyclus anynana TaxID=110368 RepID=A0ABM3M5N1_BICAN|nr:tigger transposable element-derived protein 4-like [Bicyclus anynana]